MHRLQGRPLDRDHTTADDPESWTPKPVIVLSAIVLCVSICVGVIVGSSDAVVGMLMVAGR